MRREKQRLGRTRRTLHTYPSTLIHNMLPIAPMLSADKCRYYVPVHLCRNILQPSCQRSLLREAQRAALEHDRAFETGLSARVYRSELRVSQSRGIINLTYYMRPRASWRPRSYVFVCQLVVRMCVWLSVCSETRRDTAVLAKELVHRVYVRLITEMVSKP